MVNVKERGRGMVKEGGGRGMVNVKERGRGMVKEGEGEGNGKGRRGGGEW